MIKRSVMSIIDKCAIIEICTEIRTKKENGQIFRNERMGFSKENILEKTRQGWLGVDQ